MARISSYLNDGSLSGEDRLVGSNYIGVNNYQTNNFKLKDVSEFIQGQISISPSNSTLKTNGGVVTEIINGTSSLAIDLSATDITGQLANSDLANSSITINGTAVSLGGTITIGEVTEVTAGTYLNGGGTEGTVTLNHDDTTRTDTVSTDAPAYGDTFTVIDSLTTNATGHVTAANVKTVTIPASDDTTYTIEAVASTNDSIIRLIDSDSNNDDIKLIAGDNISLSTNESNDTITINSQAFGTVFTVATESAMIAATTTGGDIVIRTDVSKTFIHNGGSAGDVTDFSELQFSGINSIALTEGNGIELSRTTLTNADNDLTITNTLATTTERGGVKIGYTTDADNRNYAIVLDSEKMYVNVPWTDTNDNTFRTIEVDSDASGSANETLGATETLRFKKGANITLAESAGVLTISSANTEYDVVDSSAPGLAPQLPASDGGKFLKANGTYEVPAYIANTDTQLTTEQVQDIVGGMFSSNTETRISATYNDEDGIIDLVVDDMTANDNTVDMGDGFTVSATTDTTATTITEGDDLFFAAGTGITCETTADGTVTITNTVTNTNTTDWNFKVDTGTAENIAAGNTVTFTSGDGITLAQTDKTIDIAADFDGDYDSLTNLPTLLALGTTSTTALAGDTSLFSGDYDDLSNKPTIPSGNAIIDWTTDQGNTNIHTGNYNNTQLTTAEVRAKFTEGTNITITDGEISATDTNTQNTAAEIRTKVGTGNNGVVPAAGTAGHFLKHDGTFGLPSYTTNTNYYLDGITKSGNTLTFSVSGATNQTYTFGSNAFNSTAYLTAEADTLATVTGRSASTSTDTTFNSHLTMGGAGHYLYAISNAATVNPTHAHGLAFSWNRSGGSRESNIIFAPGSDASSAQEADAQIRFSYKAVNGTISTAAKLWSGGNFNTAGYITVQNGANAITNARVGQWNTAYGWGNHADEGYSTFSGSYVDLTNKPTIPTNYLRDNADDTSSGSLTVVSYKFNGNASDPTDATATIYDQASQGPTISGLGVCFRTGSTPSQTGKLNSSGTFTVSGDVVAFGSPSDVTLKENVKPIENALDKVEKLQGVTFDWKEKAEDILNIKEDIGFIAQDVQKVLPELVRENDNGKLSLRHQGIISVLTEAIKELSDKIKVLENGSTK